MLGRERLESMCVGKEDLVLSEGVKLENMKIGKIAVQKLYFNPQVKLTTVMTLGTVPRSVRMLFVGRKKF